MIDVDNNKAHYVCLFRKGEVSWYPYKYYHMVRALSNLFQYTLIGLLPFQS